MIGKAVIPSALIALTLTGCGPAILAGTGTVLTRSVMEERTTMDALGDAEIKLSLMNALLNESAQLFRKVSTDVTEGRVVLTGTVPTREQKVTASRIAWETEGVTSVTDELKVAEGSGARAYLEDAWISNRLRVALLADSKVSSVNYNVETIDKVVHLTGLARSRGELAHVIDRAAETPGVVNVVSHVLTIDDPRRNAQPRAEAHAAS